MPGLNTEAILDQFVSHALRLGLFEKVNVHEPKARPPAGLTCAIWCDRVQPYLGDSGLNTTSVVSVFMLRMYQSAFSEPQDAIDPRMMAACDTLMAEYSGDFDLGSSVRNIDLLGEAGLPLSMNAGYANLDGTIYRIMDINLPVVISDAWSQVM